MLNSITLKCVASRGDTVCIAQTIDACQRTCADQEGFGDRGVHPPRIIYIVNCRK